MDESKECNLKGEVRQLVKLAVSCGRKLQSPQTGFVHVSQEDGDDEHRDVIPIAENMLWVLALLRTRTGDSIVEAKNLLDKLLFFQNLEVSKGEQNFPVYLHEYPYCRYRYQAVHLLMPLFWIVKDYQKVMEPSLSERVIKCVKGLLDHCMKLYREKQPPYYLALKMAAGVKGFGSLLGKTKMESTGEKWLEELRQQGEVVSWYCPSHLGEMLAALQVVYPDLYHSPWKDFWNHLSNTWHRNAYCYVGPALQEQQHRYEPQSTLYDLYMGYWGGSFSYRSFVMHPYQLLGALIQPLKQPLPEIKYPYVVTGEFQEQRWHAVHQPHYGMGVMQCHQPPPQPRLFHPVRIIWGDRTRTHSFICQGDLLQNLDYKIDSPKGLDLMVDLSQNIDNKEHKKDYVIAFYVDKHQFLKKNVAGKAATAFQLGEMVELLDDQLGLCLTFCQEGGGEKSDVQFFGHLQPGNRPAQQGFRGSDRFAVFDEKIFLRVVHRTSPCRVTVRIGVGEGHFDECH